MFGESINSKIYEIPGLSPRSSREAAVLSVATMAKRKKNRAVGRFQSRSRSVKAKGNETIDIIIGSNDDSPTPGSTSNTPATDSVVTLLYCH